MKKIFLLVIISFCILGIYNISQNINVINKVEYELINDYKKMSMDSEGEKTLTDEVLVKVQLKYDDFTKLASTDVSNQEKYRNEAKEYYTENNEKYLSSINLKNYRSVYISKFAPYIEFTYQRDKYFEYKDNIANEINKNTNIETAYIKDITINKVEQVWEARYFAGVSESLRDNTNTYTGQGIKVGVLEIGLVDANAACFSPNQVVTHIQNTPNESIEDHSTHMAAYIAGSDGIASQAKIYSSYLWGSPTEELDWLIDNGVNIINMSFGEINPTGNYSSDSAYFDLMVNAYKVTLVSSVGNMGTSNALVCNPALAYNVIGVGAATINGIPENFSSYIEYSGGPKPTIMALGNTILLNSLGVGNTGTSVSCAIVSGIIALLMQQYPELKQYPELVISALVSSAYQNPYASLMANGLTNSGGAGLIRYDQFHDAMIDYEYITANIGVLLTFILSKNVTLTAGETFKACLAWTSYTNGSISSLKVSNYDLYLYDSEGNVVATACSTDSNIELLQYYVEEGGEYVLKIRQVTFIAKVAEKVALTTTVMPDEINY